MSLEFQTRSKNREDAKNLKKKKIKVSLFKNFKAKDLQQTIKLLVIGLSLGSGILGAAYLISVGISPYIGFIFGAGVLAVHLNYIATVTKS